MNLTSNLIVMLTYNDMTVSDVYEIFEKCKNTKAEYWGFKDKPLPLESMKKLFSYMKQCGKKTVLEVVAYTENECLEGAKMAVDCGCDILMGTLFFDCVNDLCKEYNIKYMPFVGEITGRPSVLSGDIDQMIEDANQYLKKGVYGFDLLGYRYVHDPVELNKRFVSGVDAPVCIAGSVNSLRRLDELNSVSPWAFTIGSAFFDNKFNGTFSEQIDKVCEYMSMVKI